MPSYVESVVKRGYGLTEVMQHISTVGIEVTVGVEPGRHALEAEAEKRGLSIGKTIAALTIENLRALYPEFFDRAKK